MEYKYYGGFLSKLEYFNSPIINDNLSKKLKPNLYLNSSLLNNSRRKPAQVVGFADCNGGLLRYLGTPTRLQRITEARDAFVHQNSQTTMYHVTSRKKNAKGETVGIELLKTNQIKQIWLKLLTKMRIFQIEHLL